MPRFFKPYAAAHTRIALHKHVEVLGTIDGGDAKVEKQLSVPVNGQREPHSSTNGA
jgi:hypothetical protein